MQNDPQLSHQGQQKDLPPGMIYGDQSNHPQHFDMDEAIEKLESAGTNPDLVEVIKRLDGRLKFAEGVIQNRVLRGGF